MTPEQYYQAQLSAKHLEPNSKQLEVIHYLTQVYHHLIKRHTHYRTLLGKIHRQLKPHTPIRGLYLWGSVGIGKTFLMDIFYHCLPVPKMRLHFHAFMQNIHQELTRLQGQKNPLSLLAKELSQQTMVLCFDEFTVSNIADAMLLGELFKALFNHGVSLIATSNTSPDDLYAHGLQRERFVPAIELIKRHTHVIHLTHEHDYRRHHAQTPATYYYFPMNANNLQKLEHHFSQLIEGKTLGPSSLQLFNRTILVKKQADGVIWFDFTALCDRPRSQKDYLALVKHYHTVLISAVPQLECERQDRVLSFIHLVDVLYDNHTRTIICAAVAINELYPQGTFEFAFQRTQSRLLEMQTTAYWDAAKPTTQQ